MTDVVVSNTANVPEHSYSQLVAEVYIDPVRNVVVVDDEFPTLDALIAHQLGDSESWNGESRNAEAVRDILSFCRGRARPWLVDVHDGREINISGEVNIAQHLHHSDLMILDYHLLGDDGSGEKSIQILKQLANNPHFNLVVVYTKGYSGDIERVFNEIAIALSYSEVIFQDSVEFARVSQEISEWEDEREDAGNNILNLISLSEYLKERTTPGTFSRSPAMPRLLQILKSDELAKKFKPKEVVAWIFQSFHNQQLARLSKVDFGNTCSSYSEDVNWIKTNSLFVTVVNKRYKAHELEQKLSSALENFAPAPHQLLMARMRAEIDKKGVIAEAAVLDDKYMQAGWLMELFNATGDSRPAVVRATVDRHWEALGDRLRTDIDEFAHKLIDYIHSEGRDKVMSRYGGGVHSEVETVLSHVNLYNSTKPVDLTHLRTGHIFQVDGLLEKEYWICLSPICDLVPGQKTNGWRRNLGGRIPFVGVKLDEIKISKALEKIQENINLFIQIEGTVRSFSYCPEGNPMAAPHWEQMFVLNNGLFNKDKKTLNICRVFDADGEIKSKVYEVHVLAQLRNEYAANLLQKLGGNFSRVGLNFRSRSEK